MATMIVYSGIPGKDESAERFDRIHDITPEIEAMAGDAGTELSKGGMVTKLEAENHPLKSLFEGGNATWFDPQETPVTARKKWIAGQIELGGSIIIDVGAARALSQGKSLLPAGVTDVKGSFSRGDVVAIVSAENEELGCGLVSYDAKDARQILGCQSEEIESILGMTSRGALIHRDNLVLRTQAKQMDKSDA